MNNNPWDIIDKLAGALNTVGTQFIDKKDVYNFLMGDTSSLDKYLGDTELEG